MASCKNIKFGFCTFGSLTQTSFISSFRLQESIDIAMSEYHFFKNIITFSTPKIGIERMISHASSLSKNYIYAFLTFLVLTCYCFGVEKRDVSSAVPLNISFDQLEGIVVQKSGGDYKLALAKGGVRRFIAEPERSDYDAVENHYFTFEYTSEGDARINLFYGLPFHKDTGMSKSLPAAKKWNRFVCDLRMTTAEFVQPASSFRIDIIKTGAQNITIRNLQVSAHQKQWDEEARQKDLAEISSKGLALGIEPKSMLGASFQNQTVDHSIKGAKTCVFTFDQSLDLDAQTKAYHEFAHRIDFAPPLVVGQGEHPSNHTVVRVLSRYGICEAQFLAFPEKVRGGVDVSAGRDSSGEVIIAAAPLADENDGGVRLFSRYGALIREIDVDDRVPPPYAIVVGDFGGSPGDEILITSRKEQFEHQLILKYAPSGELLQQYHVAHEKVGPSKITLAISGEELLCYSSLDKCLHAINPSGVVKSQRLKSSDHDHVVGVFPSAFDRRLGVVANDPIHSKLIHLDEGEGKVVDVGKRENQFWIAPQLSFGTKKTSIHWDDKIKKHDFETGTYLKRGEFAFVRTNRSVPAKSLAELQACYASYDQFKTSSRSFMDMHLAYFDSQYPALWEAMSSQRKNPRFWTEATLSGSDVARYCVLNRLNGIAGMNTRKGGEFDLTFSYKNLPLLNKVMTYGVRSALREIATRHRMRPEHFIGVEPVHEFEIKSSDNRVESIGDYNPESIKGFYHYLMNHYGSLENINRVFKTPFTSTFFDAPRDLHRGDWDRYDREQNPFLVQWWKHNVRSVYGKIFGGYREALLAGFAPETISAHQIPDHYALGGRDDFFKTQQKRISPVDNLYNSGVGFGFTRYRTWYKQPQTMIKSSFSSGFSMMSLGEYAPMNTDPEASMEQLINLWNHGAYFIHHMAWDPTQWPGCNQAALEGWNRFSATHDRPRPHAAGGVTKVVPYVCSERSMDLIGLGSTENNTGMIKSVLKDGSWEGSVYTVPFHSQIEIESMLKQKVCVIDSDKELRLGQTIDKVYSGTVIDISFRAEANKPLTLKLHLESNDHKLPHQKAVMSISPQSTSYRIVYRFGDQVEKLSLWFKASAPLTLTDLSVIKHEEQSARLRQGAFEGERNKAGVFFAVIPE